MKSASIVLSLAGFVLSFFLGTGQSPDALCCIGDLSNQMRAFTDQVRTCAGFVLDLIRVVLAHAAPGGGALGIFLRFLFMGLGLPSPN